MGATDSVLHAGPAKGKKLVHDKDAKVVPNLMVSNPTAKWIGPDTFKALQNMARA